jgi:hypothetical protein
MAPILTPGIEGDKRYYKRSFNSALIWNLQHRPRRQMYDDFMRVMAPRPEDKILDLGTCNVPEPLENYFEYYYPYKRQITAAGVEDCQFLEDRYPGLHFVRLAAGQPLPFKDNTFDIAFSSATIEHVGSYENQGFFLREMMRVSRRSYLTTPNRWYPFELHTRLPFVHWLPPKWFRKVMDGLGYSFYASEANLNLLSARRLRALVPSGARNVRIKRNYFFGFPSNLMLSVEKRSF